MNSIETASFSLKVLSFSLETLSQCVPDRSFANDLPAMYTASPVNSTLNVQFKRAEHIKCANENIHSLVLIRKQKLKQTITYKKAIHNE